MFLMAKARLKTILLQVREYVHRVDLMKEDGLLNYGEDELLALSEQMKNVCVKLDLEGFVEKHGLDYFVIPELLGPLFLVMEDVLDGSKRVLTSDESKIREVHI